MNRAQQARFAWAMTVLQSLGYTCEVKRNPDGSIRGILWTPPKTEEPTP